MGNTACCAHTQAAIPETGPAGLARVVTGGQGRLPPAAVSLHSPAKAALGAGSKGLEHAPRR